MELKLPLIHDPQRFKDAMRPGVQFWTFITDCGEPIDLNGPLTFIRFEKVGLHDAAHTEKVICTGSYSTYHFIGDLLNSSHGVFLSEKDAIAGFEAAREMYLHNPEMQRRVKEMREDLRRMSEEIDKLDWD